MTISMEIRLTDSELFQSWFAFTPSSPSACDEATHRPFQWKLKIFMTKKNSFPRLLSEHKLVVISF